MLNRQTDKKLKFKSKSKKCLSFHSQNQMKFFGNGKMYATLIVLLSIFVLLHGNLLLMVRSDIFLQSLGKCHIRSVNSYIFSDVITIIFDTLYEFEHLSYLTQIDIQCHIKNLTRCEELYLNQTISCHRDNYFTNKHLRLIPYTPNSWYLIHFIVWFMCIMQVILVIIAIKIDDRNDIRQRLETSSIDPLANEPVRSNEWNSFNDSEQIVRAERMLDATLDPPMIFSNTSSILRDVPYRLRQVR
jgi:hypothetical protein